MDAALGHQTLLHVNARQAIEAVGQAWADAAQYEEVDAQQMNQHGSKDCDQIRDQDATGHSRTGHDRWDKAAIPSATDGEGRDASYSLGPSSRCS